MEVGGDGEWRVGEWNEASVGGGVSGHGAWERCAESRASKSWAIAQKSCRELKVGTW